MKMTERRTVLVVEEHPRLRAVIRRALLPLGLDTVDAGDAASALARLSSLSPVLICAELVLPDTSGFELCEQLRRVPGHARTPILVLSERAYPEDRAHAADAGADAFLAKPFTELELRERVEALLWPPAAIAS